jgi:hypothetical protein
MLECRAGRLVMRYVICQRTHHMGMYCYLLSPTIGQSLHGPAALPLPMTFPAQAESTSDIADTRRLCCT